MNENITGEEAYWRDRLMENINNPKDFPPPAEPKQLACDQCSQGVMDATNPHLTNSCTCDCHRPPTTEPAQSEGRPTNEQLIEFDRERGHKTEWMEKNVCLNCDWPYRDNGYPDVCCGYPIDPFRDTRRAYLLMHPTAPPDESVEDAAWETLAAFDLNGNWTDRDVVRFARQYATAIIEKAFAEGRKSVVFEPHATYRGNLRELVVEGDFDFTKIFGEFEYEGEKYAELSEDGADAITDYILGLMEQVDEIRSEDAERYQNPQTVKARRSVGDEK